MSLSSTLASVIRFGSEVLTLRQEAAGTLDIATQTHTPGATTATSTYGLVALVERGVDGVTVKSGDLEVWLPRDPLAAASIVPAIGNTITRNASNQKLTILEVEDGLVTGYYRARARVAQ